jgi:hypothetical protein
MKYPGEKLGISIRGGAKGHPGNPLDTKDEGIFISKVCIPASKNVWHCSLDKDSAIMCVCLVGRSTKVAQQPKTRDFILDKEYSRYKSFYTMDDRSYQYR